MYETTKILSLMIHFVGLIAHGPIEYFDPLQSGHYPTRTIRKFKKGVERRQAAKTRPGATSRQPRAAPRSSRLLQQFSGPDSNEIIYCRTQSATYSVRREVFNPTLTPWSHRNVKPWRSALMAVRWTAAAVQAVAKGFRRLKVHKQPSSVACVPASAPKQKLTRRSCSPKPALSNINLSSDRFAMFNREWDIVLCGHAVPFF
jgi:hypothetical protein